MKINRLSLSIFLLGLLCNDASAAGAGGATGASPPPGVQQSGAVTAGNCTKWLGNLTIADAGSACGGGSGGSPGGTSGQVQYNNAGSFGGFTLSGDCTLVTSTGAITCTKTSGVNLGALATAAADGTTLVDNTNVLSLNLAHSNNWIAASAASTPAITFSSTPFIGTGTTSTPIMYFNDAVTQPTTWNSTVTVGGTYIGWNVKSGCNGNILDLHFNGGTSLFNVNCGTGAIVTNGAISATGAINGGSLSTTGIITGGAAQKLLWSTRSVLQSPADGIIELSNNAVTSFTRLDFGGTTSSFAAIKVTGAAFNFRLADDSADAAVTMGGITNSGGNLGLINVSTAAFTSTVTPIGSNNFNVFNFGTQTGNVTFAAPSGTPVDGNELDIRFVIDATGGYTTTFNAIYAFGTDVTTALIPTAASSKFELKFLYNAADSKWRAVAIARGF